ncbi:HBR094Wp [Eremothecium sinecaudum]|uniref:HBR094Wp n=1 Tax=Eremothecium sinecaudum TaxID=45286 RepID=A0A109UWW5_9SACH|nr:HBR094Wp [Eremothecium sinecaudum]AMD18995.1 HBR094Wp [Eremothecium sinecaudum]
MPKRPAAQERLTSVKRRNCIALERYCELFNRETARFFDPLCDSQDLQDSYIHVDSKVKYLEEDSQQSIVSEGESIGSDTDDEQEWDNGIENLDLGTLWTAREKTVFFHFLARNSIHNLDQWHSQLPRKSKYEITVYYRVLKANLDNLKHMKTKKRGGILTKRDLPIAYEMQPSFIELEECYSELIRSETEDVVKFETEHELKSMEEGVVNWDNWYKRWDLFYARHQIPEYQPASREPSLFSRSSECYAEEIVRRYVKKLLCAAILPVLDRKHVPKESLRIPQDFREEVAHRTHAERTRTPLVESYIHSDTGEIEVRTGNLEFPHLVTTTDIWRGMIVLRKAGHPAPTLPETVVHSLAKFQVNHEEGKLFKNKNIPNALIVPLLQHKTTPYHAPVGISTPTNKNSLVLESRLHGLVKTQQKSAGGFLSTDTFISDDPYSALDNPVYEQLVLWDDAVTDSLDLRASFHYQHALLMHMSLPDDSETSTVNVITAEPEEVPGLPEVPSHVLDMFLYLA